MTTTQLTMQSPVKANTEPRYRLKFPDFGLMDHPIPVDMIDASFEGDVCPSFEMPAQDPDDAPLVTLFVDYKDPAQRAGNLQNPESLTPRFRLHVGEQMAEPALATDSWSDVEAFLTLRRPFAGFEHDGMWITNPTCDDGGARFEVSPALYGFEVEDTGGGCTAWVRRSPEGILRLTDLGGTSDKLGAVGDTFLIGVCDLEDEEVSMHHAVVGSLSNIDANFDGNAGVAGDGQVVYGNTKWTSIRGVKIKPSGRQVYRGLPAAPQRIYDHAAHDRAIADLEAMGIREPSPAEITAQALFTARGESLSVVEMLRKQLAQGLNFLEHKLANEGETATDDEWHDNVRAYRERCVSHVGIGPSHVDRASIDFTESRAALACAEAYLFKHQSR